MTLDKPKFMKTILPVIIYYIYYQYDIEITALIKRENMSYAAKSRRIPQRISWSEVNKRISNTQFRRMFRMSRQCFDHLCDVIISRIGESKFLSESYSSTKKSLLSKSSI